MEIRDAEWVIKRADLTSSGTSSLLVTGISELVRGKEARFLTEIDRDIKPLHPEDTELVRNTSPRFANARLYLESQPRQAPPTDSNLWIGHRAAIDLLPYQLDPALQALGQIRHRILLADSVGLGKTIEVRVLWIAYRRERIDIDIHWCVDIHGVQQRAPAGNPQLLS